MSIEAMNAAWELEKKVNPATAYNSWCRGYEAGRKAIEAAEKQERESNGTRAWYTIDEFNERAEKLIEKGKNT